VSFFLSIFLLICFLVFVVCLLFGGSGAVRQSWAPQAALQTQGLNTLTRCHATKVASAVCIEACCLAVGDLVGHSRVLSASRMNNATVVVLGSVDKANKLVEQGIVIDGEFI